MAIINGRGRVGVRKISALPSIITNGLRMHLDAGNAASYPGTGTIWTDISGNGYNGTLNGGAGFSNLNGGSITFDGLDEYININSNLILNTNAGFTISSFFKITSYASSYPTLFTIKTSIGSALALLFQSSGTYAPLSFGWNGNYVYRPSTTISANVWYNIALTYNGNGIDNYSNFKIYINGVSLPLSGSGGFAGVGQVNTLGALNSGTGGFWFKGNISNIQVYDRALASTEVLQNFNVVKSRFGL